MIETTGSKRLVLISGRAHPELAKQIAAELGSELVPTASGLGRACKIAIAAKRLPASSLSDNLFSNGYA